MGAAAQTTHQTHSRDTKLFAPDQSKAINKLRRVDSMFLLFQMQQVTFTRIFTGQLGQRAASDKILKNFLLAIILIVMSN